MRPEKQRLLDEVLDNDARRRGHLDAGVRMLRRRRFWRTARRGLGAALALALVVGGLELRRHHQLSPTPSGPTASAAAQAHPQSLTDDQLLALFPNTPVALATLADGKKRLIFPRPEDERRFVRYP